MQEHEYLSGYEQRSERNSEQVTGQADGLTEQAYEQLEGLVDGLLVDEGTEEISSEAEELELLQDRRSTLRVGRGLIVGLVLSFLASLAALWLSSTLLSAPDQLLPLAFLQVLAANRILVLSVPVVCLVICYVGLRSLTSEIMAVPERSLDERQKMLRDQAHRSAFKVIKFTSVLIPVGFLLPHLPWFNSPTAPAAVGGPLGSIAIYDPQGKAAIIFEPGNLWVEHFHRVVPIVSNLATSAIQPASTLEIVFAAGLLLVGLLLTLSALPMAALAWKGNA